MFSLLSPQTFSSVANLTLQAGAAIMDIYGRDFKIETKEDSSPLTEADLAAHGIICTGLNALSDWPVLSEESKEISYEQRSTWSTFWLVDPLDGTKEFIRKNGEFTVNIALISDGVPVAGFVYAPVLNKLYCGIHTVGSFLLNSSPTDTIPEFSTYSSMPAGFTALPVETDVSADTLRVVASRSHRNQETDDLIAKLSEGYKKNEIVSSGSSLKLCLVAEGKADVYPRLGPTMEWDTGAAQAVVEASGKTCVEYESKTPLRYNKKNLLNPYFLVS